jgi:hypothetical protein
VPATATSTSPVTAPSIPDRPGSSSVCGRMSTPTTTAGGSSPLRKTPACRPTP